MLDTSSRAKVRSVNKAIIADECRDYLRRIYEMHEDTLKLLFPVLQHCPEDIECPMDIFFMDVIPVPPPVVRPANKFKNEIREHPQTSMLKSIIDANQVLRAVVKHMNADNDETLNNETQVCKDFYRYQIKRSFCFTFIHISRQYSMEPKEKHHMKKCTMHGNDCKQMLIKPGILN